MNIIEIRKKTQWRLERELQQMGRRCGTSTVRRQEFFPMTHHDQTVNAPSKKVHLSVVFRRSSFFPGWRTLSKTRGVRPSEPVHACYISKTMIKVSVHC